MQSKPSSPSPFVSYSGPGEGGPPQPSPPWPPLKGMGSTGVGGKGNQEIYQGETKWTKSANYVFVNKGPKG